MLSIGEFSRVAQLSIKALRLYHEKGILVPGSVNLRSKYRYYGSRDVERARVLRRLANGKALTLLHYGPYEELGRSYQRLYETCREKNLAIILPSREQYLKGPGMVFRGNPKKYVTKLMILVSNPGQRAAAESQ